jgi:hypothetical protein
MLSPLDALSLAGTIVQFVDFSHKILSRSQELYKSQKGALSVNEELELVTSDLFRLSEKLPAPISTAKGSDETEEERTIRRLAVACSEISVEIATKLNGLKVKTGSQRKIWRNFKQALKSVWTEDEMNKLVERLSRLRDELQIHVIVGLRYVFQSLCLPDSGSVLSTGPAWRQ